MKKKKEKEKKKSKKLETISIWYFTETKLSLTFDSKREFFSQSCDVSQRQPRYLLDSKLTKNKEVKGLIFDDTMKDGFL